MKARGHQRAARGGFTLIEVMVTVVVFAIAMSIATSAYMAALRAWKRGVEVIDGMKHGDFAVSQLVSALNSTIYFRNARRTYAFTIEKERFEGLPADVVSFVTSSGAFVAHDSPLARGPHRIKLFMDELEGEAGLYAVALPAVADAEEVEKEYTPEPFLVSPNVRGLALRVWDATNEEWKEEWEPENSVPERVALTVWMGGEDPTEEPIEFRRVLEIPVAESVRDRLSGPTNTRIKR